MHGAVHAASDRTDRVHFGSDIQSGITWRRHLPGGTPHAVNRPAPARSIAHDVQPSAWAARWFAARRSRIAACALQPSPWAPPFFSDSRRRYSVSSDRSGIGCSKATPARRVRDDSDHLDDTIYPTSSSWSTKPALVPARPDDYFPSQARHAPSAWTSSESERACRIAQARLRFAAPRGGAS